VSTVTNAVTHWTAGARNSSKWIFINPAFEASAPQHGIGNFAVNSRAYWRTLGAMSNPIFQNLCFIRTGSVDLLTPVKIVGIIPARFAFSPLAGAEFLG
jgi:hypothetical protein